MFSRVSVLLSVSVVALLSAMPYAKAESANSQSTSPIIVAGGIQLNGPLGFFQRRQTPRAAPAPVAPAKPSLDETLINVQMASSSNVQSSPLPALRAPLFENEKEVAPQPLPRPRSFAVGATEPQTSEVETLTSAAQISSAPLSMFATVPEILPRPLERPVAFAQLAALQTTPLQDRSIMSAAITPSLPQLAPQPLPRPQILGNAPMMPQLEMAALMPSRSEHDAPIPPDPALRPKSFAIAKAHQLALNEQKVVKPVHPLEEPEYTGAIATSAQEPKAAIVKEKESPIAPSAVPVAEPQVAKTAETKAADTKQADTKAAEVKPSEAKPEEPKVSQIPDLPLPDFKEDKKPDDKTVAFAAQAEEAIKPVKRAVPRMRQFAGESLTLTDAVALGLQNHPEIGISRQRVMQATAGMKVAKSPLFPQVDARLSYGVGDPIPDTGSSTGGSTDVNTAAGTITLRQLLFDFGATRKDIDRTKHLYEAERFRVLDKMDEIALKTSSAYLKVLEDRELASLADEYVGAHQRLAALIRINQVNGNGTLADVNRVSSRLLEAETIRTNFNAELDNVTDQFRRITHVMPGKMAKPGNLRSFVPPRIDTALEMIDRSHPLLLAITAGSASIDSDIQSKRAQFMPRIGVELEGTATDYSSPVNSSDADMRGMLVMRHKIFDGGARTGLLDQARSRFNENELRYRNEREEIELTMRQAYRALESSKTKLSTLQQAVDTSNKVNEMYIEQFKAGKRTLFELLDAQTVLYNVQRDLISSRYEELRARFVLLRSMGSLAQTLSQNRG